MVYSFDVFDTLITRNTYTPKGVFLLIQKVLCSQEPSFIPESISENFCDLRIYAEHMASRIFCKEITLDDIYEAFGMLNNIGQNETEYLKRLEIKVEKENIIGVKENINFLKNVKKNGVKTYLISDMYLPSTILKDFLLSVDEVFNDIDVLVSCDLNKSKRKGDLFSYLLSKYGINNNEWTHIGDNIETDVYMVKNLGGKAILYQAAQKTSFLYDYYISDENELATQIVYGNIKKIVSDEKSIDYNIGASIAGPILHSYVSWILKKSKEQGVEHLFFYSRDGYLLKKIADIIIGKENNPIKTHYLYGSRETWYTAPDCVNTDDFINQFLTSRFSTISQILTFFNISISELNDLVNNAIIMDGDYDKFLSNFERVYIQNSLINAGMATKYLEKNKKIRGNTKEYLLQEIPMNGKIAFVDLQGTGKSQKCMKTLIGEIYPLTRLPVNAFYYAFYPMDMFASTENAFFIYSNKIFPVPGVLEVLARAPHGQTVDYRLQGQKWIPVFSDSRDYPDAQLFQDYEEGIIDYTRLMADVSCLQIENYRKLADNLLFKLGTQPDVELQNFIGEMPFEVDFNGNIKKFGPRLNDAEIENIYKNKVCDKKNYKGCSFDFSLLRMTERQKRLAAMLGKFGKQGEENDENINNALRVEKKVIIYGMGKRGVALYNELSKRDDIEIVLLVDKNCAEKKSLKLNIHPVEKILETDFDYIVISVLNEKLKLEILDNLLKLGISRESILI